MVAAVNCPTEKFVVVSTRHSVPFPSETILSSAVIQPSRMVALLGTFQPSTSTSCPLDAICEGPTQGLTSAAAQGSETIMNVSKILNITFRLLRMSPTPTESGDAGSLERPSGYRSDPKGLEKSHWRELNTRPTPYQGVAIPLSHSGSKADDRGR